MRIGLIDVDGHNYPNIALMKLSAFHKANGDSVEWYDPWQGLLNPYDKVYMSKVFSFSEDYEHPVYAKEIQKGGSGYCIDIDGGKEVFHKERDAELPPEIEHTFPDYSIYYGKVKDIENCAYGFLTRGCPRGCSFCIVGKKETRCSHKVADLKEFWNGQKHIELMDPNFFACKDWKELAGQLIESKAEINFNQGCDIRIMNEEMIEAVKQMKIDCIHFAWDRMKDEEIVTKNLESFKRITGFDRRKIRVYMLTNFDTTFEEDIRRVMMLRNIGVYPYVMIYEKYKGVDKRIQKMQRWVNNRFLWESNETFEQYLRGAQKDATT